MLTLDFIHQLHVLARLRVQHKIFTPHPVTHKFDIVHTEFAKVHHATWSSKQMLRQIRQNVSIISTRDIAWTNAFYSHYVHALIHHGGYLLLLPSLQRKNDNKNNEHNQTIKEHHPPIRSCQSLPVCS